MAISTFEDYAQKVDTLNLWLHLYRLGQPSVTDAEYDSVYRQVQDYERDNPLSVIDSSPTRKVDLDPRRGFVRHRHETRMWSLDNVCNKDELSSWIRRVIKDVGITARLSSDVRFCLTPKYDGVSLNLLYHNGRLVSASTRGNGHEGELVTGHVPYIQDIPALIPTTSKSKIEIRGEVLMTKTHFRSLNDVKTAGDRPLFANARNAVAGSMHLSDPDLIRDRNLRFIAWGVGYSDVEFATLQDVLNAFRDWGFVCPIVELESAAFSSRLFELDGILGDIDKEILKSVDGSVEYDSKLVKVDHTTKKIVKQMFEELSIIAGKIRENIIDDVTEKICAFHSEISSISRGKQSTFGDLDFLLDGIVVMLDDLRLNSELGWGVKSPRFACAYKFESDVVEVRISSVTPQVGRTGVITPVAEFDKVLLGDVHIGRAMLHSYREIVRKDIRINDVCLLVRSGDVIPKITTVLTHLRNDGVDRIPITRPSSCPSCGGVLINKKLKHKDESGVRGDGVHVFCSSEFCLAKLKGSLVHFCSRKCMDINGLGDKLIGLLVDLRLISSIRCIYDLKVEDLLDLDGFKDRSANNIIDSISSSIGSRDLWRFIHGLSIPGVGESASKSIASLGLDFYKFDGHELPIDDNIIVSFRRFCEKNEHLIQSLLSVVRPIAPAPNSGGGVYSGKRVLITGRFDITRDVIKERLEQQGVRVLNSVNKTLNFLLVGKDPSPLKIEKAVKLGIDIVSDLSVFDLDVKDKS